MCIQQWFGSSSAAAQQLALAKQQASQAAAAVANANLDTEAGRTAAEATMRKANVAQGFSTTLFGGSQSAPGGGVAYKALFGA